jgi:hypothetical protein
MRKILNNLQNQQCTNQLSFENMQEAKEIRQQKMQLWAGRSQNSPLQPSERL